MKADWKNEAWSKYLYDNIPASMLKAKLSDGDLYYKGYNELSDAQKREFFVMLFSSLARFESGFNPKATYVENFKDIKGKNVISAGLFQVSIESANSSRYGNKIKTTEQLFDPLTNIKVMLSIMAYWIPKTGKIATDSAPWGGASAYWSVFRKPERIAAIRKNTNALTFTKEKPVGKSARLAIIVGHERKSKGAYSKHLDVSEYTWNSELAVMMKVYAGSQGIDCEVFMRDGVGIAGAVKNAMAWKPSCIVELHYNSFDGKASGTETLYSDSSDVTGLDEVKFAKMVNDAMVQVLGTKDRGIKKLMPGGRGYGNLSQTKDVPSILIESFFGDSKSDCASAAKNKLALAKAIVSAFKGFRGI